MIRGARFWSAALIPCALLVGACADSARPELGGDWTATITGAGAQAAGAALVELTGAGILRASALDSRAFTQAAGDTMRVVVVRAAPGTLRFTVQLERGSSLPNATVLDLADGQNRLLTPGTRFTVSFTR